MLGFSELVARFLPPPMPSLALRKVVNGGTTVHRLTSLDINPARSEVQCIAISSNGNFMMLGGIDGVLDVRFCIIRAHE